MKTFAPLSLGDESAKLQGLSERTFINSQEHQQLLLVYQAHLIFPYSDHQAKEMVIKRKVKLMILPGPPNPLVTSQLRQADTTPSKSLYSFYCSFRYRLILLPVSKVN